MMNDLDKLSVISKKLGRVTSQSRTPQLGKIAFYANNQNLITEIFFEGCNLLDETIPSELWELSHLEKLYLNDNQLLNFPLQLIKLKKLRILNLKNNQFQVISSRIQELSSLEDLDLCDNKLQTIPMELGNLPHLKKLRLNDNLLTSFPELSGNNFFKNLISLDLDYAKVQELPQWIFKIPNLKFLSLTGLHLNRFPIQICLLKKLERLYLDSTKFQIYPQDFELPDSLKLIVLDGAQISKIPNTIVEKRPLYIRNQMNISSKYSGLQVSIGNLFPELDETLILSSNPEISYKYNVYSLGLLYSVQPLSYTNPSAIKNCIASSYEFDNRLPAFFLSSHSLIFSICSFAIHLIPNFDTFSSDIYAANNLSQSLIELQSS